MDRPSRKTKAVNYCESRDPDDDEDFAFAKAPPSKKPRESGKQEGLSTGGPQSRKPLAERLHGRDLEAALTLSLLNRSRTDGAEGSGVAKVLVVADENADPKASPRSNCCVDGTAFGLEEISVEKENLSKQRKAAEESGRSLRDEDEDYEPKVAPESDSDEEFSEPESEGEEFSVRTKKKAREKRGQVKAAAAPKKPKSSSKAAKPKPKLPGGAAAAAAAARRPPGAKVAAKPPSSSSSGPPPTPAVSPSPAGGRVPRWNPPGQVGRSPSSCQTPGVRSPGPGLRLGLSRLVQVKPLHPQCH